MPERLVTTDVRLDLSGGNVLRRCITKPAAMDLRNINQVFLLKKLRRALRMSLERLLSAI
jgi:hypothetical protein